MPAVLAVVLPLALGGAFSPVMLTEQTVLPAGPGGLAAGVRYAAGAVLTLLVLAGALALVVPAAKEVGASDLGVPGRAVVVLALVGVASLPAWGLVALTELAPGPARRGLRAIASFTARRGRAVTLACLAGFGALLVLRGALRLLGA